jgi:hypothetical protein
MGHAGHTLRGALAACVLLVLLPVAALGQTPQAKPDSAQSAAAPPQVAMPDADRIVLLVRTTLLTLNDALQTGNFTVLRDMGAPGFRQSNSAARLSVIFANLTQRGIDLSPVAIIVPQLGEVPTIDPKTSMLRIKGHFPGRPVRIDFDLIYQAVDGRWRLFGLSVQPATTPPDAAAAAPPPQQGPAKFAPVGKSLAQPAQPPAAKKPDPPKK